MPEANPFLLFVGPLHQAGIAYSLTGSIAAIFYGEPRLTHDADFVVHLEQFQIEKLRDLFPQSEFYLPPSEVISIEARREHRGHFNIIHLETGFKADFYLTGEDEMNAWAIRERREFNFEGQAVTLAPPEYVIVRKLEYYREGHSEKHLRDIRTILASCHENLDYSKMAEWIQRKRLEPEWNLVAPK